MRCGWCRRWEQSWKWLTVGLRAGQKEGNEAWVLGAGTGCKALGKAETEAWGKPCSCLTRLANRKSSGEVLTWFLCRLGLSSPGLLGVPRLSTEAPEANSLSKCFEAGSFHVSLMTGCSECSIHFSRCGRKNQLCSLKQVGWNSRSMNSELNVSIKSTNSNNGLQLRDCAFVLWGYAFWTLSFFKKSKCTK